MIGIRMSIACGTTHVVSGMSRVVHVPYALPGVGDGRPTPRSADRARSHAASAASGTGTVTRLAIGCSYYGVRFL